MRVRSRLEARKQYSSAKTATKRRTRTEKRAAAFNYRERNRMLIRMGFGSYANYLKSKEWRAIRVATLDRHRTCLVCRTAAATEAHHRRYTEENLLRFMSADMVGLCHYCHERVEFKFERGIRISKEFRQEASP